MPFKLSVIIPVYNGALTLDRCLKSIRDQIFSEGQIEILVLDSCSTDNSLEIANVYGVKIINIPEGTFDHGLTRNEGVQHATGDFIFFTVQDAWLSNNNLLEKMTRHFDDPEVMGVVGHQAIPHEKDKNPALWYRPISAPSITIKKIADPSQFKEMQQDQQQALVAWDNVVAIYRRNALVEQPFVQTAFAEDWIWSYNALLKGWKLLHDSSLVVYHYHHQFYKYMFNSTYTVNYHFLKFFGYHPIIPNIISKAAKATYHLVKHKELTIKEKISWLGHNYISFMGEFNSTINFLLRLKIGGLKLLESGYKRYCRKIPQGRLSSQKPQHI